jgi:hypothetical protein
MRTGRTADGRDNWKPGQGEDIGENHQEIKGPLRWFQPRRVDRRRRQHDRRNQARRLWGEWDATEPITSDRTSTAGDKKMVDCSIYTAFRLYPFVPCLSITCFDPPPTTTCDTLFVFINAYKQFIFHRVVFISYSFDFSHHINSVSSHLNNIIILRIRLYQSAINSHNNFITYVVVSCFISFQQLSHFKNSSAFVSDRFVSQLQSMYCRFSFSFDLVIKRWISLDEYVHNIRTLN